MIYGKYLSVSSPAGSRISKTWTFKNVQRNQTKSSPSTLSATHVHHTLGGVHAELCDPPLASAGHSHLLHQRWRRSKGLPLIWPSARVLHYRPRALWMSWVVNHYQLHISVCLGAAHLRPFSSQSRWEITSKCWQISRFTETGSGSLFNHTTLQRAPRGGGAVYLANIKEQSGGLAMNFAEVCQPELQTDASHRSDPPSCF